MYIKLRKDVDHYIERFMVIEIDNILHEKYKNFNKPKKGMIKIFSKFEFDYKFGSEYKIIKDDLTLLEANSFLVSKENNIKKLKKSYNKSNFISQYTNGDESLITFFNRKTNSRETIVCNVEDIEYEKYRLNKSF